MCHLIDRYEAIVSGDPELVVEYRGKMFYFETEEKLQKFMRYSGLYHLSERLTFF